MIRAFLAIPMPDDVASRLVRVQMALGLSRPVAPENLHLTLLFLGEHPESVLEDLHLMLERVRVPAFDLRLDRIGHFGADVRQVHAAAAPNPTLEALHAKLAQTARTTGIALERRRFVPHVTLSRAPADPAALARTLPRLPPLPEPFPVTGFAMMRSTLTRNGADYDILATYALTPTQTPRPRS